MKQEPISQKKRWSVRRLWVGWSAIMTPYLAWDMGIPLVQAFGFTLLVLVLFELFVDFVLIPAMRDD